MSEREVHKWPNAFQSRELARQISFCFIPIQLFPICFHRNQTKPFKLNREGFLRVVFVEFSLIALCSLWAGAFS